MPNLFDPLAIRGISLKNRLVVSPMCQYSSEDGFANDWHLVHLGSRAVGGAAMVIVEATAVTAVGRISPGDLGIWKDEHIQFLQKITEFISAHGAVPAIQLAHAGRKASHQSPWNGNNAISVNDGGWETIAPSPVAYKSSEPLPLEMSAGDIANLVIDFTAAATRAIQAGFKMIEIHAAHGYLVNQFLSPTSNFRNDSYGGSFENRIRLLLEIVTSCRNVMPQDMPLFVRISATEWVDDGWNLNDSIALSKILQHHGVDVIDCSSGGNSARQKITTEPLYQLPFAAAIKKDAGIMTAAVGMITTAREASDIINNEQADLVLMAREFLRDPYFPLHAAKELGVDIEWPLQYQRAK